MISESEFKIDAPAKINLFLQVKEKLDNGYHVLDSIMQSVTLYDTLILKKTDFAGITLKCSDKSLENEHNIVIKAAKAFYKSLCAEPGVSIILEKKIPVAAGLGGGSSDAAATLIGLNHVCGSPYDQRGLIDIGKTVGSDVPFCIVKNTCRVGGTGDTVTKIKSLPQCFFVIAKDRSKTSAKEAYEMLDRLRVKKRERSSGGIIEAIDSGDIKQIAENLYNSFEQNENYDKRIKELLLSCGAENSLMSGSGPCVFGIFTDHKKAVYAEKILKNNGYTAYVCKPE